MSGIQVVSARLSPAVFSFQKALDKVDSRD